MSSHPRPSDASRRREEAAVTMRDLTAAYPAAGRRAGEPVLRHVDLAVPAGELLAVLGPSGCGKTTLLRVIAGLLAATEGTIELGGRVVVDGPRMLPPERRRVGLVPQDAALFPHLDVAANVEFGLRSRRAVSGCVRRGKEERRRQVRRMLDLVGLAHLAHRHPHELSGGQRQRVAVARALAPEPALVLLDEPFGALDASLRTRLRVDVRRILRDADATAILVTHDQNEALSIADRIAVMREGRIVQTGVPADVYERPADGWVAVFLGECSVLPADSDGTTVHSALGPVRTRLRPGPARVVIRPEQVELSAAEHSAGPDAAATVTGVEYLGHSTYYRLRLPRNGESLTARAQGRPLHPVGALVSIAIPADVHVLAGGPP